MLTRQQIERWENLVKRLDAFARDGSHSVVTVHVLTDETGRPLLWTDPERVRLEPKAAAVRILDILSRNGS